MSQYHIGDFLRDGIVDQADMDAIVILKRLREEIAVSESRCHICGERPGWRMLFDACCHLLGKHTYTVQVGGPVGCGPEAERLK
jgi:hypothetical protein